MVHNSNGNDKLTNKARALVAAGRVHLTDGGASVTNDTGFIYRVDFDLGGRPHCQCRGFEFTGWCKHLTAAYMAAGATGGKPEDGEPAEDELATMQAQEIEDEYWRMAQEEEDRARDLLLDAGMAYGDAGGAAYALAW